MRLRVHLEEVAIDGSQSAQLEAACSHAVGMNGLDSRRPLVLIIEDDQASRRLYASELQHAGFNVAEAHNGLQAVEKAAQLIPDAIVTDLGLPGIDGYELCRRLHRDDRLNRIPIVAITGRYFSPADIARAHREGCHAVLIKPFVGEELIAEVRRALDR
jgi:CheY-like chemotaxis protein